MIESRFDPVIHAPARLQLCALLVPLQDAEFSILAAELEVSDSVLSKHIKQLAEAGYLKPVKRKSGGRQRTWVSLTTKGRKAFAGHVAELQRLAGMG
jgi:DNA-binding MarR family transcriptional regulator